MKQIYTYTTDEYNKYLEQKNDLYDLRTSLKDESITVARYKEIEKQIKEIVNRKIYYMQIFTKDEVSFFSKFDLGCMPQTFTQEQKTFLNNFIKKYKYFYDIAVPYAYFNGKYYGEGAWISLDGKHRPYDMKRELMGGDSDYENYNDYDFFVWNIFPIIVSYILSRGIEQF